MSITRYTLLIEKYKYLSITQKPNITHYKLSWKQTIVKTRMASQLENMQMEKKRNDMANGLQCELNKEVTFNKQDV